MSSFYSRGRDFPEGDSDRGQTRGMISVDPPPNPLYMRRAPPIARFISGTWPKWHWTTQTERDDIRQCVSVSLSVRRDVVRSGKALVTRLQVRLLPRPGGRVHGEHHVKHMVEKFDPYTGVYTVHLDDLPEAATQIVKHAVSSQSLFQVAQEYQSRRPTTAARGVIGGPLAPSVEVEHIATAQVNHLVVRQRPTQVGPDLPLLPGFQVADGNGRAMVELVEILGQQLGRVVP